MIYKLPCTFIKNYADKRILTCFSNSIEILNPDVFPHGYQPVRKGTNGGVTKTGLLAATAAGGVIGLTFVLIGFFTTKCASDVALKQLLVIPLSAVAGLCGSLIDSLLGATLQYSGFCSVRNKVTSAIYFDILFVIMIKFNLGKLYWEYLL